MSHPSSDTSLQLSNRFETSLLDRINRIFRISFLRHFPEESGETQSRPAGGIKSQLNYPQKIFNLQILAK
jgi:hypothetical protein